MGKKDGHDDRFHEAFIPGKIMAGSMIGIHHLTGIMGLSDETPYSNLQVQVTFAIFLIGTVR